MPIPPCRPPEPRAPGADWQGRFAAFARKVSDLAASPWIFLAAFVFVVAWIVGGAVVFGYGDTYQLVINTSTTIVTFLMTFVIQNTAKRDTDALHAKLDELIRTSHEASDSLIGIERRDN